VEQSLGGWSHDIANLRIILYTGQVKRPDWMRISLEDTGCTALRVAIPSISRIWSGALAVGTR